MAVDPLAARFLAHRAALIRFLRARGAGDEAEDLAQEMWLKIEAATETVVIDGPAYLYRMAHNLMLDRRRAAIRREQRERVYDRDAGSGGSEVDDAPAAERILIARDGLGRIDRVLRGLGDRTDHIFRRHRIDGIAQRDIAAEQGISLSAVEKHLQKAYRAVAAARATVSPANDRVAADDTV